jgi:hypothetical protein
MAILLNVSQSQAGKMKFMADADHETPHSRSKGATVPHTVY